MSFYHKNKKFSSSSQKGLSLVETLVGSAVFLIVALSTYRAFNVLMDAVRASQAKIAATSLANERFEIIRNLPYTDVGIMGGLPVGKINRNENIVRDNYTFNVQTTIRSTDDPFDGTIGGNPADTSPADYKLVDLDITCPTCKIFNPIKFTTLVAARGLETGSTNGALFVQIFDANGLPVQGASVHISNLQPNPDIIIDETSDNTGWVRIVDALPGVNAYNITATKSGYSQDQTYPAGGGAGANPLKLDSTVVTQQITQISLAIDKTSILNVSSVDSNCAVLPNTGFSLTGTKLIGNPAVKKYPTQNFTTNASGIYTFPSLEWDTYSTLLTSALYDLAGTNPLPSFSLSPNQNTTLKLVAVPHSGLALLVSVKDSSGNAIDGATVRLQKGAFDQTKTTNSGICPTSGQVFWNGLVNGAYTMTISKAGFQNSVTAVNIAANWQQQNITLNP